MRYLNMLLGLAMLGFAAVQYNDPDVWLWVFYYIVPAAWAFLAAFRLDLVRSTQGKRWLWASLAAWLGLVDLLLADHAGLLAARGVCHRSKWQAKVHARAWA